MAVMAAVRAGRNQSDVRMAPPPAMHTAANTSTDAAAYSSPPWRPQNMGYPRTQPSMAARARRGVPAAAVRHTAKGMARPAAAQPDSTAAAAMAHRQDAASRAAGSAARRRPSRAGARRTVSRVSFIFSISPFRFPDCNRIGKKILSGNGPGNGGHRNFRRRRRACVPAAPVVY